MTLASPTVGRRRRDGAAWPVVSCRRPDVPPPRRPHGRLPGAVRPHAVPDTRTASSPGEGGLKYGSPDEKNKLLVAAWADALRDIRAHPAVRPRSAPAVLGAHVHVHGSSVGPSLFRITDRGRCGGAKARICREQFDYVALGHIHKPQWLGATHMRYSGSIERMDLGEQGDQKGVVTCRNRTRTAGTKNRTVLPLPATAIYSVVVLEPSGGHSTPQTRVSERERRPCEPSDSLHCGQGSTRRRATRPGTHLPTLVRARLERNWRARPDAREPRGQ